MPYLFFFYAGFGLLFFRKFSTNYLKFNKDFMNFVHLGRIIKGWLRRAAIGSFTDNNILVLKIKYTVLVSNLFLTAKDVR